MLSKRKIGNTDDGEKGGVYFYNPLKHAIFFTSEKANEFWSKLNPDTWFSLPKQSVATECKTKLKPNKFWPGKAQKFMSRHKRVKTGENKESETLEALLWKSEEDLKAELEKQKENLKVLKDKLDDKNLQRNQEVTKLVVYYGTHVQNLLTEFNKENPIDPNTGEPVSLKELIEKLKLDKKQLQWNDDDDDWGG